MHLSVVFKNACCLLLAVLAASPTLGDDTDPAYDAAVDLLRQATQPQADGRHIELLRGLRKMQDPDLLPWFELLTLSKHPPMQVYGVLGVATLQPDHTIDLTKAAQIEDATYLGMAISAAMDDKLITTDQLKAVIDWKDLAMLTRLIIATKLNALGEAVDTTPLKAALSHDLGQANLTRTQALEYAYAALFFAELDDPAGAAALQRLLTVRTENIDFAIGVMLQFARRDLNASAGPIALAISSDNTRESPLRIEAMRTALRLNANGAQAYWLRWLGAEPDIAQRARLAITALDASPYVDPSLFDPLIADQQPYLQRIGALGRAIAAKQDLIPPAVKLLAVGQPTTSRWVLTYIQRDKPDQAKLLLEATIRCYAAGLPDRWFEPAMISSDAVVGLCEIYPDYAAEFLPRLLNEPCPDEKHDMLRRGVVLNGILGAKADRDHLATLAARITEPRHESLTDRGLRLLVRARFGAPLTEADWQQLATYAQGVGGLNMPNQAQLAWLYLKHKGLTGRAIADVLK